MQASSCPQNMISNSKPELFVMLKLKGTNQCVIEISEEKKKKKEISEEIRIVPHRIRNQHFKS